MQMMIYYQPIIQPNQDFGKRCATASVVVSAVCRRQYEVPTFAGGAQRKTKHFAVDVPLLHYLEIWHFRTYRRRRLFYQHFQRFFLLDVFDSFTVFNSKLWTWKAVIRVLTLLFMIEKLLQVGRLHIHTQEHSVNCAIASSNVH
jgi:hypothetical protein